MKWIMMLAVLMYSSGAAFAAGPVPTDKEFNENTRFEYEEPRVDRMSEFERNVAYYCIDGYVYLKGSSSHGPLAQIIIKDADGLPVPMTCRNKEKK